MTDHVNPPTDADLERERRLYEAALSSIPDFVYVFSLDHRVVYANDALLRMWGVGREGAIGKTFLEIGYEPWHADLHNREIDEVRYTKKSVRGVVPFTGTSGRRHYEYIFVPVFGADGEVEAVAGTTRDVTERHKTDAALRESEERHQFLFKLADTLRPLSDPIEVQAEASRVLGEYLGASRVLYFEIVGDEYVIERDYTSGVESLAARYPVAAFGPALLNFLLGGRTVVETDATTQPERSAAERASFASIQCRAHVDVPLVKGGRFVAGLTVHRADAHEWTAQEVTIITDTAERTWAAVERARVESALRASEERRRLALDAAELGSWQIDLRSHTFTTDERLRQIFTGTTDALTYDQALAAIHPDDRERIRAAVEAATRADVPTPYVQEHRIVHPDGSVRWVLAQGRANYGRDGTGRLVSFDGAVADITARKQFEERQEQLVEQLRDQDRRKDEFLATLAHELRNPLAPIRNGVQVMKLSGASGPIERARAMIERQVNQLVRLVDDLLDVSRVTSGKLELRKVRVDLAQVVEAAIETVRPVYDQSGHQLSVSLPDTPIELDADATRLAQVIANLLSNSARYTPPGGQVRITASRERESAVVKIADNGIGIPEPMLGKIFDMFTQVDRSLEKSTGGLGIGLSLVKGLVDLHGGTVEARSRGANLGSEFTVRLPLTAGRGIDASPLKSEQPTERHRLRFLVADDNVDSAESLGMVLDLLGNEVSLVHDGQQAVSTADRLRPDVILLDIGMPKVNGYDACRRIRQMAWAKGVKIIAMTGWGQDEDRRRSFEAGFDLHLVKPVDFGDLENVISTLVAGGR